MHIGVDVLGLPYMIMVTTASVTDRNGAIDMVDYYCDVTNHFSMLKKILVDGGYTGENFANAFKTLSGADVEVVKRSELHTFAVLPKRWIVERSFAGSISAADFGKTVSANCRTLFKCFLSLLFVCF